LQFIVDGFAWVFGDMFYGWISRNQSTFGVISTFLGLCIMITIFLKVFVGLKIPVINNFITIISKMTANTSTTVHVANIAGSDEEPFESMAKSIKKRYMKFKKNTKGDRIKLKEKFLEIVKLLKCNLITISGTIVTALIYIHATFLNNTKYDLFNNLGMSSGLENTILAILTLYAIFAIGKEGYETTQQYLTRKTELLKQLEIIKVEKEKEKVLKEKEKEKATMLKQVNAIVKEIEKEIIPEIQKKVAAYELKKSINASTNTPNQPYQVVSKNCVFKDVKYHYTSLLKIFGATDAILKEKFNELAEKYNLPLAYIIHELNLTPTL
jgi:hypothetical protein